MRFLIALAFRIKRKAVKGMKPSLRRIDDLGRVVIPKEMRHELGCNTDDFVELVCVNKAIIVKRAEDSKGNNSTAGNTIAVQIINPTNIRP